jgi:multiple antibiotic resistance protein
MMTSTETIKFIVAMIIMMNPLGSLSIFLDLTHKTTIAEQRKIALNVAMAIVIIMLITVWTGKDLLTLLGITIPSFRVAGGLILLLMGLSMLQSQESPVSHTAADDVAARERHSIAIVPMALPVIVGPGSISTLIIAAGDFPQLGSKLWISLLCLALTLGIGIMLYFAAPIARIVGASVIKVVTRIMGMIIMAIAVGMLANGLMGLFPVFN